MIKNKKIIFFDFDGVIKESLDIKGKAFQNLFKNKDQLFKKKVLDHHILYGGVSRYEKIPLYLKWAGFEINENIIDNYQKLFSHNVVEAVINSDWVPGAELFIKNNYFDQNFYLVSATPEKELIFITKKIDIFKNFIEVRGSPEIKEDIISSIMKKNKYDLNDAIMIGDMKVDLDAARHNSIDFILRSHKFNQDLINQFKSKSFNSFIDLINHF